MGTRKYHKFEQYPDFIARIYPELMPDKESKRKFLSRNITFQVTDSCNLACTYCYQINKGTRKMSFETAKKLIDLLLSGDKGLEEYISCKNSPAIILEFIGGEPFLEIDLIDQIVNYFRQKTLMMNHSWADKFIISICSNGILYSDKRVQEFLHKNAKHMSFSITIDGNRELHDSCRIFPDGRPSYDIAVRAVEDWISKGFYMGSKITIAPENLSFLYAAINHMCGLGYDEINANVVFEEGWTLEHAVEFYKQLKIVADYLLQKNEDNIYCSLFEEDFFRPKDEKDLENWCGGTGEMLSCDPDGYLYPCIRYMESSLGSFREPMRIGDVNNGLGHKKCYKDCIFCLQQVNRRSQSVDECFYCPIGTGCSWCSAHNYQVFGTVDKRATYICNMHRARALANVYYWNNRYKIEEKDKKFEMHCPENWALEIIDRQEYIMLKELLSPV